MGITLNEVTDFLTANAEDPDVDKYLQSITDRAVTKGIESWKENNLEDLLQERRKEEGDPLLKQSEELTKLSGDLQKKEFVLSLREKAIALAIEKEIPLDMAIHYVGHDEDQTAKNIDELQGQLQKIGLRIRNEMLKGSTPQTGVGPEETKETVQSVMKRKRFL